MSLRLILGNSGSGKTYTLFSKITELAAKNPDINYIIVVPEQFTLQTQHDLVRMNPRRGILNIDVLSIQRLAHRIFEEVGYGTERGQMIDDMGKNLVLRHLADKYEDQLTMLGGNIKKLGYISEVKSVISEFMQYGIGMNEISMMINNAKGHKSLQNKLMDIQVLYNAFREDIKNRYITTEEMLERASSLAHSSKMIKKSVIAFDGFTGFTPVQYKFIESLMLECMDIYVTAVIDTSDERKIYKIEGEQELFYLSKTTIKKISDVCEKTGHKKESDILLKKIRLNRSMAYFEQNDVENSLKENKHLSDADINNYVDQCGQNALNPMLEHFEKNLFRPEAVAYQNSESNGEKCKKTDEISVFCGNNPRNEIIEVAKRVKFLISEEGYSYSDIAIITGDLDTYMNACQRVFDKFDIPYFIDKTVPVLLNPLVEYVRAVMAILSDNYSYEAMFRYLKSSLACDDALSMDDVGRLENYALAIGLNGRSKWKKSFVRQTRLISADDVIYLEELRKRIVEPFADLEESLNYRPNAKYTVNELCRVLYEFVSKMGIQSKLAMLADKLKEEKNSTYSEMNQIFGKFVGLLEQLNSLLGDEKITIKEFSELLDAGFDEIRTGILPASHDYVIVGDITRTRLKAVKALFFVGVNDGIIPKSSSSGGILSDMDREVMLNSGDSKEKRLELAPSARMQAYTQQLYLYMMLTKPSDRLFLSYSLVSEDGKSLNPSYFINTVKSLFPQIVIQYPDNSFGNITFSKENLYEELCCNVQKYATCEKLNQDYTNFKEAFEYLALDKNYSMKLEGLIDSSFGKGAFTKSDTIGKAVARAIYGSTITNSVTRLESYASCAYRHFLQYGLTLKEREEYEFKASDLGSVFHDAVKAYSEQLRENGLNWLEIDEVQRDKLVEEAVVKTLRAAEYATLYETKRTEHLVSRISRITRKTIDTLTDQLRAGSFVPLDFEMSFSVDDKLDCVKVNLSDRDKMYLMGRIDRLDEAGDADNLYIKVIDYKSGNKTFDLAAVYKGLDLQLIMYLIASKELMSKREENRAAMMGDIKREIVPAAVMYYHIDDPVIKIESEMSDNEIKAAVSKLLKMNGLVNSDRNVYTKLDNSLIEDSDSSDIIPVKIKKDGNFDANSSVASTEEFEIITEFVSNKIREMGKEMLSGNIAISPHDVSGKDEEACKYCGYKNICQHHNNSDNDLDSDESYYSGGNNRLEKNASYIAKMEDDNKKSINQLTK